MTNSQIKKLLTKDRVIYFDNDLISDGFILFKLTAERVQKLIKTFKKTEQRDLYKHFDMIKSDYNFEGFVMPMHFQDSEIFKQNP